MNIMIKLVCISILKKHLHTKLSVSAKFKRLSIKKVHISYTEISVSYGNL